MSILYSKSYDINLTVRNCNVYFHIPIKKSKSILTIFTLFSIDETETVEYLKTVFLQWKGFKNTSQCIIYLSSLLNWKSTGLHGFPRCKSILRLNLKLLDLYDRGFLYIRHRLYCQGHGLPCKKDIRVVSQPLTAMQIWNFSHICTYKSLN